MRSNMRPNMPNMAKYAKKFGLFVFLGHPNMHQNMPNMAKYAKYAYLGKIKIAKM